MATKKKTTLEVTPVIICRMKELRKSCGLRTYMSHTDRSFVQWHTEAENLMIRVFGEGSNQCLQFNRAVRWFKENAPSEPHTFDKAAYYKALENGHSEAELRSMSEKEWGQLLKKEGILKEIDKKRKEDVEEYVEELSGHVTQFKEKMRDAFTVWINEIEMFLPEVSEETPKRGSRSGSKNILIANQITTIKIDVQTELKNVIKYIHEIEADPEKATEAEQKVKELGEELKKETTKWSTVKDVVIWIANYSKDLFVKILPILLEHYSK